MRVGGRFEDVVDGAGGGDVAGVEGGGLHYWRLRWTHGVSLFCGWGSALFDGWGGRYGSRHEGRRLEGRDEHRDP